MFDVALVSSVVVISFFALVLCGWIFEGSVGIILKDLSSKVNLSWLIISILILSFSVVLFLYSYSFVNPDAKSRIYHISQEDFAGLPSWLLTVTAGLICMLVSFLKVKD